MKINGPLAVKTVTSYETSELKIQNFNPHIGTENLAILSDAEHIQWIVFM